MKMCRRMIALALVLVMTMALSGCMIVDWIQGFFGPGETTPSTSTPADTTTPVDPTESTGTEPTVDPTVETTEPVFTPSVAQKGAPLLADFDDENGDTMIATINDENKEVQGSLQREQINVIALSERNNADVAEEKKAEMEAAYDSLFESDDLGKVAPGLVGAMDKMETDLTAEDLVVRDLFHVEIPQEALAQLAALEDSTITVVFNLADILPGDTIVFMQYFSSADLWYVIDPENVEILEDGFVKVSFERDIGTLAILVERA